MLCIYRLIGGHFMLKIIFSITIPILYQRIESFALKIVIQKRIMAIEV